MELLLFDTNPFRRKDWLRLCISHSLDLHCFDELPEPLPDSQSESRILVFEKSLLPEPIALGQLILSKMPYDVIAFSFPKCPVAKACRLMRMGARWIFDSERTESDFELGLRELLRDAEELNTQLQQFNRMKEVFEQLTQGERVVLDSVVNGVRNNQIAKELQISIRTVEFRRSRLYRKFGVRNVPELMRFVDQAEKMRHRFGL